MIGDRLEKYTFESLMATALSYVPDTVDKRQGSIIYDALASACYELALGFMEMRNVYKDTYAHTATGQELDLRVAEQSIARYQATHALKRADFSDENEKPIEVPIGSRYSTISDINPINYVVVDKYYLDGVAIPGAYILECEEAGVIGNEYTGTMTNITFVQGLANVEMSTLIEPARDTEDDEDLRARYFDTIKIKPFGGNIAQYKKEVGEIDGVGQVQVYPVWNGGGTVKCSIVDPQNNPVSNEFINTVQSKVDPENSKGDGGDGLGIAPIGHVVTISTPEVVTLNIECNVFTSGGYVMDSLKPQIVQAISDHIDEIRAMWDSGDEYNRYNVTIYLARINAAILRVPGVINAYNITINGASEDMTLIQSGELQQIPALGEVILHE